MPRPRYHNSPRPQSENIWVPSLGYRLREVLKQIGWVLMFPIMLPLALLFLPYFLWEERQNRKKHPPSPTPAPHDPPRPIDPELERRRELARQTNIKKYPFSVLYDPIRDDPAYAWAIKEAGQRASEEIGYKQMGDCHRIWNRTKEILKEEFDIVWYSPQDMNPSVRYD